MDRIDDLLLATLTREAWREEEKRCEECPEGRWAVWRCIDCSLSHPTCRQCMRRTHRHAPLHRIECWNGSHFRQAALWEVGTYILVEHGIGTRVCKALKFQIEFLEKLQLKKDEEEQLKVSEILKGKQTASASATSGSGSQPMFSASIFDVVENNEEHSERRTWEEDALTDEIFFQTLDNYRRHETQAKDSEEGIENIYDGEDNESDVGEEEVDGEEYLHTSETPGENAEHVYDANAAANENTNADIQWESGPQSERPSADALNNTYVRVLHTNGIHHLAMVTCNCQGGHNVSMDLVRCRFLPASFTKIRTLFTVHLMDYFRLSNLELKSSAYQFYQLIRRLTMPMAHASVINLYHEFRRMSRLWRWMKKLKWAGYGHNKQDALQPNPGSLANYCPTCPQPGINLPDNWKDDQNR